MVAAEESIGEPKLPPTSIINDYLVAWLGATGAVAALLRRATEGGSYRVHVSLDRVALGILTLGMFDPHHYANVLSAEGSDQPVWLPHPRQLEVADLLTTLAGKSRSA